MSTGRGPRILIVLSVAAFVASWNFTFVAPVLRDIANDAGVSVTAAGQLVSVSAAVAVVCLAALGPVSDLYGRRPSMMIGLGAMALAAFGSALTSEYSVLLALRALSGLADALVLPSAMAAASDYFDGKDRARALNLLLVPLGAAAVFGLPLVVLISHVSDWHAAFLAFAAINSLTMIAVWVLLPEVPPAAPVRPSLRLHYRESYGEVFGQRAIYSILVAAVLGAATWNGLVTYAGAFFEAELGARGIEEGLLFGALGGSYVVGAAFGAVFAGRFPPRSISVVSGAAATVLPLPVMASSGLAPLCVGLAVVFAMSRAPGVGALNNLILDLAPHSQSTAVSVHGMVFMGGAFVGAMAGGVAIHVAGFRGLGATLGLASAVALGALLLPSKPANVPRPDRTATGPA